MTPEAEDALVRANENLGEARMIAALPLARAAARSAYYAMFHAAEALIFERTGRAAKTHSGVRSEFARLTKDVPGLDRDLPKVLARGYEHKEFADYGTDRTRVVTDRTAAETIAEAARFVERVTALLLRTGAEGP